MCIVRHKSTLIISYRQTLVWKLFPLVSKYIQTILQRTITPISIVPILLLTGYGAFESVDINEQKTIETQTKQTRIH
jgi:hypothetical protein